VFFALFDHIWKITFGNSPRCRAREGWEGDAFGKATGTPNKATGMLNKKTDIPNKK
jgi:hypothetical protein